jgi:hypothetical protein
VCSGCSGDYEDPEMSAPATQMEEEEKDEAADPER